MSYKIFEENGNDKDKDFENDGNIFTPDEGDGLFAGATIAGEDEEYQEDPHFTSIPRFSGIDFSKDAGEPQKRVESKVEYPQHEVVVDRAPPVKKEEAIEQAYQSTSAVHVQSVSETWPQTKAMTKSRKDKNAKKDKEDKAGKSGCFVVAYISLVLVILLGIAMVVFLGSLPQPNRNESGWPFWPFSPPNDGEGNYVMTEDLPPPATPAPTHRILPQLGSKETFKIDQYHPTADIADNVSPSVVAVVNKAKEKESDFEYEFGDGSGVILSQDGYIVTNYHVIVGANTLYVKFYGEEIEVEAALIGYDTVRDLAVLKVDRKNLKPAKIGDSDVLRAGEIAITIGNPLGTLNGTVTQGIISSARRRVEDGNGRYNSYIQIDAPINPGNSGGALVNGKGEVVGINTSKAIYAGIDEYTGQPINAEGIGYAIPMNDAMSIIKKLIEFGYIDHPGIGISGRTVDPEMIKERKCPPGVWVDEVIENSPAAKGGLKIDDDIYAIDGKEVKAFDDVVQIIEQHSIGDEIVLSVWRNGERVLLTLKLASKSEYMPEEK